MAEQLGEQRHRRRFFGRRRDGDDTGAVDATDIARPVLPRDSAPPADIDGTQVTVAGAPAGVHEPESGCVAPVSGFGALESTGFPESGEAPCASLWLPASLPVPMGASLAVPPSF